MKIRFFNVPLLVDEIGKNNLFTKNFIDIRKDSIVYITFAPIGRSCAKHDYGSIKNPILVYTRLFLVYAMFS